MNIAMAAVWSSSSSMVEFPDLLQKVVVTLLLSFVWSILFGPSFNQSNESINARTWLTHPDPDQLEKKSSRRGDVVVNVLPWFINPGNKQFLCL